MSVDVRTVIEKALHRFSRYYEHMNSAKQNHALAKKKNN